MPHKPNSKPAKPLDGYRVLDFTQNIAGPLAGQVLADLGAEVIKIEAPVGEAARHITAVLPGRPPLATLFLPHNRGKKSVTADLTSETLCWKAFVPGSWNAWAWALTTCGPVTPDSSTRAFRPTAATAPTAADRVST